MESTGDWTACQSKNRDRYLLESSVGVWPKRGFQNVLKVEIGVRDAELNQKDLLYELHVTIRLVKIIYVDTKSVTAIGD